MMGSRIKEQMFGTHDKIKGSKSAQLALLPFTPSYKPEHESGWFYAIINITALASVLGK